jgi:hypothetical protein
MSPYDFRFMNAVLIDKYRACLFFGCEDNSVPGFDAKGCVAGLYGGERVLDLV